MMPLMNLACFLQQEGICWGLSQLEHIFLLPRGQGTFGLSFPWPQTLFCALPSLTSSLPLFQGCLRMHRLLSQTSQGCWEPALLCLCHPAGLRT